MQVIIVKTNVHVPGSVFDKYSLFVCSVAGLVWCHVFIMLTVDRFLRVYLNIKYPIYVTEKRVKVVIFLSYFLGICYLILLSLVGSSYWKEKIWYSYVSPIYMTILILVFLFTNLYIYLKIRAGRSSLQGQPTNQRQNIAIIAPFLIVATFFVLIVIPNGVLLALGQTSKLAYDNPYALQISSLLLFINFTVDALIYILIHNSIRNKFFRFICGQCAVAGTN